MRVFSKLYFLVVFMIVAIIVYMFLTIDKIENDLKNNIEDIFVSQAKTLACNIETRIKKSFQKEIFPDIFTNMKKRIFLEKTLQTLITPVYRYVYVLYRDKKGRYRYFIDGSPSFEKGEFTQRFDVDKTRWDKAYDSGKDLVFKQDLETVWTTLLHPIVYNGKTELIVAIDFSMQLPLKVVKTIEPLKKLFLYVFIAMGILIVIVFVQIYTSVKIKKQSYIDPLTGVFNRQFLRDFLNGENIDSFAIMMIDIDHFKQVNDHYGHKVGDFVLRKLASIFKDQIRDEDVIVRFGGEEFLIFLKKNTDKKGVLLRIARRLHKSVANHRFTYNDLVLRLTISIGFNFDPSHFKSASDAIKYADELLYMAKRSGRNKIVSNPDHSTNENEKLKKSIYETKEALEDGRVECHYQPIVDAQTGEVVKYEALVRLIDKDGSIVPPALFLQNIIHTNLYNELTKFVIQEVFSMIKKTSNSISLNLNFSDIIDNTFYNIITTEIEANKEFADKLTIELLEYELLDDYKGVRDHIANIRSYGVKIALDDFGSGYANYTLFKEIDIDIIKIDGSIIKDIDRSEVLFDIAKSIVVLAKALDIEIVAEFVHSKEIYEKVKELGITYAQGFYLGKPEKHFSN